ncbi:hypothetical protein GUITHDRAFT_122732 [Guillardia theta CCMP2712]|uniref:RWP-RK domain-containing protein n=1 Tax=Guillardia theta (strain CCMP2712) TaxID=905079 RepID=L1I598_GUITC|nr:hypothetical protein GUITHDRAFT_122732 [Guillardia theta CCMP2712]EKX31064.1 hypothetical protein GUITHDRAFT_122732 [Guillardia theta CCMP2712]|eukprot:XP_005818044.1 hypothetical protein GUITHDRAFT_122732 [Guillardia theta CCMP2712]
MNQLKDNPILRPNPLHVWSQPVFSQLLVSNTHAIQNVDDSAFLTPNARHDKQVDYTTRSSSSSPHANNHSREEANHGVSPKNHPDDHHTFKDGFVHTDGPFVRVLQRSGEQQVPSPRRPAELTKQTLRPYLALSQTEAARSLGMSLSAFKRLCKKVGLEKWPYARRKGSSQLTERHKAKLRQYEDEQFRGEEEEEEQEEEVAEVEEEEAEHSMSLKAIGALREEGWYDKELFEEAMFHIQLV